MLVEISVIIPTFDRSEALHQCLQALVLQEDVAVEWEIIVVDDGSSDNTAEIVQRVSAESPVPIRYVHQSNRGPAAARNRGIRKAEGRFILMTDSDVHAEADLVHQHLLAHADHPDPSVGVLGLLRWSPNLEITPFMVWWEHIRFRFDRLLHNVEPINHTYFYTCNVSVKRQFLLDHGLFNEDFPSAAYEDTELAYRLKDFGFRLVFAPDALAYHDHPTDFAHACQQMTAIGKSSTRYQRIAGHSGLPRWWLWLGKTFLTSKLMVSILRPIAESMQSHIAVSVIFVPVLVHHFMSGRQSQVGKV